MPADKQGLELFSIIYIRDRLLEINACENYNNERACIRLPGWENTIAYKSKAFVIACRRLAISIMEVVITKLY